MMRAILLALVAVVLLAAPAVGCTGAAAMGMGFAYLAVADNPDAVYWAPDRLNEIESGISYCVNPSGNSMYDFYTISIGAVFRLGNGNIGLSYFERDGVNFYGMAIPIMSLQKWTLGTIFYICPEHDIPMGAIAAATYTNGPFRLAARFDGAIRMGVAYQLGQLTISAEKYYLPDYDLRITNLPAHNDTRFGLKYQWNDFVFYAGAYYFTESKNYRPYQYYYEDLRATLGASVDLGALRIISACTLGKTYRLSIEYEFNYLLRI